MTDRASAQIPEVPLNADAVASAAQTHGVVRVTSDGLDVQGFAAFMEELGEPMFTEGETPVPGFANLNIVTNVGRTTKPKSVFHSDTTYVRRPPKFSGLFAVDVPTSGGATLFTDQYAAFDALPASLRQLLLGATMRHAVTGLELGPEAERSARHPVVRRHPATGRDALYLTTPARCSELRLADGTDRSDLIDTLYSHSLGQIGRFKHLWARGDILVWDNRCTLHAADHSEVVGDRTLYRALVRGEPPEGAE